MSMKMTAKLNFKGAKSAIEQAKKDSLKDIGKLIVAEAQKLVPVDTGNLRDSINYEVNKDTLIVGADAEYAADIELGTSKKKSQPYLKPAIEKGVKELPKELKDSFKMK